MGWFSRRDKKPDEPADSPAAADTRFRRPYLRNATRGKVQGVPIAAGPAAERPFLEHPDGTHQRALDAIQDAYSRLSALPSWTDTIQFTAQGQADRPDSYRFASVEVAAGSLRPLQRVDLGAVLGESGVAPGRATVRSGRVLLVKSTPEEVARILEGMFRRLGIRDLEDDHDYALGVEWPNGLPAFPLRGACFAPHRLLKPGQRIGYMYREEPDRDADSGWRFFTGDESDDEANDPNRIALVALSTVAIQDPTSLPYLDAEWGSAFERTSDGKLAAIRK